RARGVAAAAVAIALAAPTAAAAPPPAERTRVIAFVLAGDAPGATRAALLMAFEHALEREHRLDVVDQDRQLAHQAGLVPRDVIGEARGLLRAGERLLRDGKTGDALARLTAAEQQLQRVLAHTSKRELARAQFLVGAAHAVIGRDADARA